MKNVFPLLVFTLSVIFCNAQPSRNIVINTDVENFWKAYDQIIQTKDSTLQYEILKIMFLDKGTEGLKAIMEKKQYSAEEYIMAINTYPSFWNSIRANTYRSKEYAEEIEHEIHKLKKHYPDLKPANIYFTIGILRTGGTAHEGHVLIGSETALADSTTVTSDIQPKWLGNSRATYFKTNPIDDVVLLNVHEYVHTQQGDYGYDLLSQCIYEGVAEFVSVLSHGGSSSSPAIAYGQRNEEKVKSRFEKEMFSPQWNDWLYNNANNEFELRDLGYYVGYAICEAYYNNKEDKIAAIKRMIELDYQDEEEIEQFSNASGYFSNLMKDLKKNYELNKPKIVKILGVDNGGQNINPSTKKITIYFSQEMSNRFRNQRIGPLGLDYLLPITSTDWAEDMRSITFTVELESNRRYQLELDNQYRSVDGPTIEKYLIDFTTGN